ncbi:MAG: helix-turn-helix domain-containing protein [Polaromonas sp.]|uniref:helix-turn-helix domain-containing protein n=1 Tax=Polaromonas sp. TaxID=1869339 RepID=UPI0027375278|nr:helix-turn-helix domain-containing protein [Polaromonas sp.]MDP2819546.1 helix-turn-helix domain-containing protein [Polaromonas sp.]
MHAHATSRLPLSARYLGPGAPAAPNVGSLRFCDVEEQASALAGWNQDYLQLSPGAFQGEIYQLHGTGIRLFFEQVQQSVFQTGLLPSDVLAVGIPLDASGVGMFCGKACEADTFHVFSGPSGFEFRTSRQHTMLGIELQLGHGWSNAGAAGQDQRENQGLPLQACALRMMPAALSELKTYLLTLFQSAQSRPRLLSNPAVVATVADFLLDRMAQDNRGCGGGVSGAACTHWKLVQQACAMVHDKLQQAPTVVQLCLDLGVSRRTLQNGFQRVLGVSPLTYLKAVRLHQARCTLKKVSSVTEAATAFGFWHFGHFSQDYQAMFGERPSDTLRRHSPR